VNDGAKGPRRWPLLAAVAAAAIALAAYGALWLEGAKTMRRSIEAFAASESAAGRQVSFARLSVGGFPFLLRARIDDALIVGGGSWRWRGETLFVEAAPWAPDRLAFSAASQALDLGELGLWRIEARRGRATIARNRERGWVLRIASGPARIAREGAAGGFGARRLEATVTPDDRDPQRVLAKLEIADLVAQGATRPVSADVIELAFEIADPPLAPSREIRLRRLYAESEGGAALLSGVFRLDDAGYPEGVLNADIAKPGAFAALLGELGAIGDHEAEVGAATLDLAAIAGGGRITAPVLLDDGVASIAGVAIAKLPRLD
jgi:hypothetical protein